MYRTQFIKKLQKYISVDVFTIQNGQINKASSKNDLLIQKQKDLIKMADKGTDIRVEIQYIPENSLKKK